MVAVGVKPPWRDRRFKVVVKTLSTVDALVKWAVPVIFKTLGAVNAVGSFAVGIMELPEILESIKTVPERTNVCLKLNRHTKSVVNKIAR